MENSFTPSDQAELDAGRYLEGLCRSVRLSIPDGIDLSFSGSACPLDAQSCRYLGMIVCELVEDAKRRNFPDGHGVIEIELTNNASVTICRIADNGCESDVARPGDFSGMVYALAGSLRATLRRSAGPNGTTWIISVPQRNSKPSIDSQSRTPRLPVPAAQRW